MRVASAAASAAVPHPIVVTRFWSCPRVNSGERSTASQRDLASPEFPHWHRARSTGSFSRSDLCPMSGQWGEFNNSSGGWDAFGSTGASGKVRHRRNTAPLRYHTPFLHTIHSLRSAPRDTTRGSTSRLSVCAQFRGPARVAPPTSPPPPQTQRQTPMGPGTHS